MHVPQRETGMSAYEMMLSESQERMLAILKPGREHEGERIFEKWGLDAATIGNTTDTGHHGVDVTKARWCADVAAGAAVRRRAAL